MKSSRENRGMDAFLEPNSIFQEEALGSKKSALQTSTLSRTQLKFKKWDKFHRYCKTIHYSMKNNVELPLPAQFKL